MLHLDTGEWEPEGTGECGARVWCPDLLHEGQWHHIAIVLNRAVLKNSSFSLYLDGQHIHSQKVSVVEIGKSWCLRVRNFDLATIEGDDSCDNSSNN